MTLDPKEIAEQLAKTCADLIDKRNDRNEEELSDVFVATWNRAIKFVSPIKFFLMVCDEREKGTHNDQTAN